MKIEEFKKILYSCYSKELCYPKVKDNWTEKNKCLGMCAITALVVNDYFGGEICKIYVDEISHYFNLINNEIIDLTSSQFECNIDYKEYKWIYVKFLDTIFFPFFKFKQSLG